MIADILFQISIWALPVLIAITFHEAAHGFVARLLGDDTAYRMGRVTFNPLRHIDPFGTVLLPAMLLIGSGGRFLFGFAKPVPVDFGRLRNPKMDMVWVALAGPGVNILLAVAAGFLTHLVWILPGGIDKWALYNLVNAIFINVFLAVFNMIPLPPLDGGRVAVGLLPRALALPLARLEHYGLFILIGLLFILPLIGSQIGVNLSIIGWLVTGPSDYVVGLIASLTGLDPIATLSGLD